MRIDFFIPGEPPTSTAQEKGLAVRKIKGRFVPYAYETTEIKLIKEGFMWALSGHIPNPTPKGPVRLWTVWNWTPKGKHKAGTFRDTKPDTDNLIKLFKDAMADLGFFENDSRVVDERVIKRWSTKPGIRVIMETIEHQEAQKYGDK